MKQVAFGLDKAEKLKDLGGSESLKLLGRNVLFVRDSEKTYERLILPALSKKCNVAYSAEEKILRCPCHRSASSLDGKVHHGPAERPLTVFSAKLDGDRLIVSLPQETE